MSTNKLKDRILEHLVSPQMIKLNPERKNNKGGWLFEIFLWQTIGKHADQALKDAWAAAQREGVVPSDDELRELDQREDHIVAETDFFSVLAKVSAPRGKFDKEKFFDECAKTFKVDRRKVVAVAAKCTTEGNPALSKSVVEA